MNDEERNAQKWRSQRKNIEHDKGRRAQEGGAARETRRDTCGEYFGSRLRHTVKGAQE